MRNLKVLPGLILVLVAGFSVTASQTATKQTPNSLVAELYKVHDQKKGPFFQTKSRALLNKYFEKSLADLIWKDRVSAKEEVGVLDGDPLYDAQDMEIKNFAIGKAEVEGSKARVNVTFENFGQKKSLIFNLVNFPPIGWRINDIDYGAQGTLRGWFKAGAK